MTDLTSESLEKAITSLWDAIDERHECIAIRSTSLVVRPSMLRKALFIIRSKHKAHLMPFKQRKATRRAKARQHASFMTPRWAI